MSERAGREALIRTRVLADADARASLPEGDDAFLRWLGGSSLLRVPGRDRTRTRVVSTLIHGNEPSGLRAVQRWLRSAAVPATDVVFWIAAVATAQGPPLFAHRALPGREDLNRCFGSAGPRTPARALAAEALARVCASKPEALVDLHNNTGHNPAYAVGCRPERIELGLTSLFGRHFVHSDLQLGSLVEATSALFPSVTIECGRAGDPVADDNASRGLRALLALEALDALPAHPAVDVLVDPLRVELRGEASLAIGDARRNDVALTVAADIDRHNFQRLERGTVLGWLHERDDWPLEVLDREQRDRSRDYFEASAGRLVVRQPFVPIMVTTDPAIARSDCLWYIVTPT